MLNTGIFPLSVLSDQDGVNAIVWGLISSNRAARSDVGKEVECPAESQVERDMAFADWGLKTYKLAYFPITGRALQQEDP